MYHWLSLSDLVVGWNTLSDTCKKNDEFLFAAGKSGQKKGDRKNWGGHMNHMPGFCCILFSLHRFSVYMLLVTAVYKNNSEKKINNYLVQFIGMQSV